MARNIGGELNLAVWRMSGQSAKLKSAKHSTHGNFDDHVLYARQIKIRQSSKKGENDKSAKYYYRREEPHTKLHCSKCTEYRYCKTLNAMLVHGHTSKKGTQTDTVIQVAMHTGIIVP